MSEQQAWEVDPGEWWNVFEVNVLGIYLCCRAVIPGMLERGAGRIVITGSGAAYLPGSSGSAYAASKAAVWRFGEVLAEQLLGRVPVFVISPGLVRTEALEASARRRLEEQGVDTRDLGEDDVVTRYYVPRRPIPLGRIGRPDDVAGIVALLCSEQASWITGACIDVDGGWVKSML